MERSRYGARSSTLPPVQSEQMLADWGIDSLAILIARDSQSDETSDSIPSTEGQVELCDYLAAFFDRQGLTIEKDEHANLIVHVPANPRGSDAPPLSLLAHLDTSRGTEAVKELFTTPAWEGTEIAYPANDRVRVTVDDYPETEPFLRQDLVHGPGNAPIGLDNKLGIAELMTLVRVLLTNPEIEHGEVLVVFRPDEEIGRMAAVESLADALAGHGVELGYTIDGIEPFEVNVENFNAARARVTVEGDAIAVPQGEMGRVLRLRIDGVKSHGATAKAEGYLNATVVFARVVQDLGDSPHCIPMDFQSDPTCEVSADSKFYLSGPDEEALEAAEAALLTAFERQLEPHEHRGARVGVEEREDVAAGEELTDEALSLAAHLYDFLSSTEPQPLLSEESEGREGYSNPYFVERTGEARLVLSYRLRAFEQDELDARAEHIMGLCLAAGLSAEISAQYVNMGPALKDHPQLIEWAQDAAKAIGAESSVRAIRGGTGVDPFLDRGIFIANLGTGYFAPESEKEFTSRQMLSAHVVWLAHLVQIAALRE